MSDEEKNSSNTMIMVAAVSAVISGGGTHLATKESEDSPVNTTTIEDCRAFSEHAREHERTNCEIEKTKSLIDCNDNK